MNKYMKIDTENIFSYNPNLSEREFMNMVLGEGDEGYDKECAEEMYSYYTLLYVLKVL